MIDIVCILIIGGIGIIISKLFILDSETKQQKQIKHLYAVIYDVFGPVAIYPTHHFEDSTLIYSSGMIEYKGYVYIISLYNNGKGSILSYDGIYKELEHFNVLNLRNVIKNFGIPYFSTLQA